jgi:hypothetical protein
MSEAAEKRKRLLLAAALTAMFTWGIMAYVELGKYAVNGILFARLIAVDEEEARKRGEEPIKRPYVSDFVNVYNAGVLSRQCLTGDKVDIYNIEVQDSSVKRLIAPVVPESPFYLQYPPYFFALMTPLAYMGMLPAWLLWNIVGLLLMYLSQERLNAGIFSKLKNAILFGFVLSSFPCWLCVHLGQPSLYIFIATALLAGLLEGGKAFNAGLISGIHMIKFQYYPVIGLIGLITGKTKFLLGAIVIFAALMLLSVGILGVDNVVHYPQALLKGEAGPGVSGVSAHLMQNVRGQLFVVIGDDGLARKIAAGLMIATWAFITWLWFFPGKQFREREPMGIRILLAATLLLMLMTSLHSHSQDYVLVGLAGVMLWPWLEQQQSSSPRLRFVRGMFVWWAPLSWIMFFLMQLVLLTKVEPFLVWAFVVSVPLLLEILQRARQPAVNETLP